MPASACVSVAFAMDLSVLLAREGIQADDAESLVAWARRRAAALVAHIEPESALAQQLGVALESARRGQPAAPGDAPVPRQPSRSAPRPINRQVSSPHLGAAVQAALSRNEPALEKALEIAEEPPAAAPEPVPEPAVAAVAAVAADAADDEDPSIGGFNRFAFSLRRRITEAPVEEPPAPVRGVEPSSPAEDAASESAAAWQAIDLELPAPPGFETRPGQDVPTDRGEDGENSDGLVVGIPDDDSIDIPLPRPRAHSSSRSVAAATAVKAPSGPHPEAHAAQSSERLELDSATLALDGLDIDIPEPPVRETTRPQPIGRPASSPSRAAPPPPPPRSGPHRAASGPTTAASGPVAVSRPPSAPEPAMPSIPQTSAPQKYPTPQSSARRGKTSTAEQKQVPKSEPKPAANKKGSKGRKKVVDLSVPVPSPIVAAAAVAPRKASIGNHQPTGEPSSPGHQVPAYLQDDDE